MKKMTFFNTCFRFAPVITFVIGIILLFSKPLQSQIPLTADAGGELTAVCLYESSKDTTAILGGNPAAFGGTPPYIYSWSSGSNLNDDSIANPYFTRSFNQCSNGMPFSMVLTVIDAAGDTARDTTVVQTAFFHRPLSAMPYFYDIAVGDSVYIEGNWQIGGGFKPYSVVWRPTTGLRDTASASTWAMPDSHVSYSAVITDSIGCEIDAQIEAHRVRVHPVSTADKKDDNHDVKLYPNPAQNNVTVDFPGSAPGQLTLFSTSGKEVYSRRILPGKQSLNLNTLSRGVYLYQINGNSGEIHSGKLRLE